MANCNIVKVKGQIALLQKVDCSKQSNPQQCKEQLHEALTHAKNKLAELEADVRDISGPRY